MTMFPENSLSDYTTKLPMDMCLEGQWEVGVSEILYPYSWFNVVCGSPLLEEENHYTFRTIPREHWLVEVSMARPS